MILKKETYIIKLEYENIVDFINNLCSEKKHSIYTEDLIKNRDNPSILAYVAVKNIISNILKEEGIFVKTIDDIGIKKNFYGKPIIVFNEQFIKTYPSILQFNIHFSLSHTKYFLGIFIIVEKL